MADHNIRFKRFNFNSNFDLTFKNYEGKTVTIYNRGQIKQIIKDLKAGKRLPDDHLFRRMDRDTKDYIVMHMNDLVRAGI